jgi:hypothetical protein
MPLYDLKNNETGEIVEKVLTISKMEELTGSGVWSQIVGAPHIVSGVGNPLSKTPDAFKDVLRNVKDKSPHATMEIN